jgi:hypothetical protein
MGKRKWNELSTFSRTLIVIGGAIEILLLAAALIDIRRRPASQIRGSKRMWSALALVDVIGPISYFAFGRKRT